ncbi:hypothetical protein VNO78_20862 [Psophocarpus tetragonolobus]|uniref:Uncharacterized protein n=1 Tax=Psophocarpus tetragonolobus TaxID=3891 RepID=A0AAN9XHV9_PSOTE
MLPLCNCVFLKCLYITGVVRRGLLSGGFQSEFQQARGWKPMEFRQSGQSRSIKKPIAILIKENSKFLALQENGSPEWLIQESNEEAFEEWSEDDLEGTLDGLRDGLGWHSGEGRVAEKSRSSKPRNGAQLPSMARISCFAR